MTFEDLFRSRMALLEAQKHVAQAGVLRYRWVGRVVVPIFRDFDAEESFFTIERLLVSVEKEFEEKVKLVNAKKRKALNRRIDRQVTARRKS